MQPQMSNIKIIDRIDNLLRIAKIFNMEVKKICLTSEDILELAKNTEGLLFYKGIEIDVIETNEDKEYYTLRVDNTNGV